MNQLDLIIILLVTVLAVLGYMQGFIIGFASLFGVLLGGIVGVRVAHGILQRAANDASAADWAPLAGLLVGVLITIVGAMAMQDIGAELRARVHATKEHVALDHALGAILLSLVGLLLVWFSAASAIGMPQLRSMRSQIIESSLVGTLNATLPDAGPIMGALASYDPFPKFDGGTVDAAPPDESLPDAINVRRAARSVVRIVGTACGYRVTGSGWVAAPGYVVTNAHVVAGEQDTAVQARGGGDKQPATVVWFDSRNDLAILRVAGLGLGALRTVDAAAPATPGVVVGFPENHGLITTPARIDDEKLVGGNDIYGNGPMDRRIVSFRGLVRHGNSGGPLVDAEGRVVTTVFASTVGKQVKGGYGVPNAIVRAALKRAHDVPEGRGVRTGPCIS